MANFTEQFVALTVATLKADGKAEQVEIDVIKFLADGLKLDKTEVEKAIEIEIKKTGVDPIAIAKSVTDVQDKEILLEACTIVALADNKLEEKEVDLLLGISNALCLPPAKTVLAIAAVAQNNREIKIAGNDTKFEEDEIIIED